MCVCVSVCVLVCVCARACARAFTCTGGDGSVKECSCDQMLADVCD